MFRTILSSETNISDLEKYCSIVKQLSGARITKNEKAKFLASEGKVVVLVTRNISSTEIASAQLSLVDIKHLLGVSYN